MAEDREQITGALEMDNCTVRDGDTDNAAECSGSDSPSTGDNPQNGNDGVSEDGAKGDGEELKGSAIGYKNLVPLNKRSKEEQWDIRSKAGKASGEARRKRRAAKDILETLLGADMSKEQREEVLGTAQSLLGSETSAYAVMFAKMLQEACKGNVNAAAFIRDSAGDKPTDKQEVTAAITQADMAMIDKVRRRLEADKSGNN